ncbi:MarR family transcriptional regulator [Streptomyces sp. NPDC002328]|uniref:MarR family transcriptional regulator n=1 Tax=Streptomyces sp. NPDC002328 TaxID=3364642 RepID=UPI0036950066
MSGYELLARELAACGRDGFTGEVRVSGSPGGAVHLRGGLVVAFESPGAPGAEALLLRSGRIGGEEWAGLVRESGGSRWPAAGLVANGYTGAAQLRVVCAMALQDAAFAVVAGSVDGCERGPGDGSPPAAAVVGEPPTRLLQDAARKVNALLALPCPVRPERERPVPASLSRVAAGLGDLRRELLLHADGRRTARDLAFLTGRGVYTVTVEVARMLGEGLLECPESPAPIPVRLPPDGQPVRPREPAPPPPLPPPPPAHVPSPEPAALPRRSPGASGITEAIDGERNGTGWKEFFRLRNPTTR